MQKFKGVVKVPGSDIKTINIEAISRAKATAEMRATLKDFQEANVEVRLYEIHRSDVDLIVRWKIDSNLIISEKFTI